MIINVSLKNWRSHLESSLKFSDGTNCIIGSVGSGKTSIFDGICFALFGTFPLLQQKKLKLSDIVMRKPEKQKTAVSEVEFEVNGDVYSVKRVIDSGRTTAAEIRKNKEVLEAQPQKVTEEVERILKVNYELFTRAVYSEQNQLDIFLTIPKGQRMKKIDELLDLDRFEKARQTTNSIIKMSNSRLNETKKVVGSLEGVADMSELESLRKELADISDRLKSLDKDLEKTLKEKSELENKMVSIEKADLELKKSSEELSNSLAVLAQINEDMNRLEEEVKGINPAKLDENLNSISSEIKILEETLNEAEKTESSLKEELYKTNARIEYCHAKKKDFEDKIVERAHLEKSLSKLSGIESSLKEKEKNIEEMESRKSILVGRLEELERQMKGLKDSKEKCPICDTPLEKDKKHSLSEIKSSEIKKLRKEVSDIELELKSSKLSLESIKSILEESKDSKRRLKEIEKAEIEIEKIDKEIESLKLDSEKKEKEIEKIKGKVSKERLEMEKLKKEHQRLKEKASLVEEFSKKEKLKASLKEKISKLSKRKSELEEELGREGLESIRKSISSLSITQNSMEVKMEGLKDIKKEKGKRLSELEIKMDIIERHKKEMIRLEDMSKQLGILEEALKLTQEQLRKDFVSAVNQTMEEMWQKLYPYGDFYSVRLEVDNDYVLQLQDDTGWISVDMVSGGERSIACLALRIAFALVLAPQLRWLILDEPSHNLDAKSVEELSGVLREYIGEFVDQVFLITHDPSMENAVSGYLYRLERDRSKNGFTKVECVASN